MKVKYKMQSIITIAHRVENEKDIEKLRQIAKELCQHICNISILTKVE